MVGFICTAVQIILWLFVQQASSVWYGFLPIWNLRKYLRVLAQEVSPSPGLTLGVRMVLALIQSTLQWSNVKVQIRATCNQINDSKVSNVCWTCVCNAMRASGLFRAIWNMEVGLCENSFMVNKVLYIAIFQREGGGWCQECERSIVGGAQAVWRHVWGVLGWWLISRRYTEDIQYLPDKKRTRLCSWRLLSPSSLSAPLENTREALVALP